MSRFIEVCVTFEVDAEAGGEWTEDRTLDQLGSLGGSRIEVLDRWEEDR